MENIEDDGIMKNIEDEGIPVGINRDIIDSDLFDYPDLLRAWVYLLMNSSIVSGKNKSGDLATISIEEKNMPRKLCSGDIVDWVNLKKLESMGKVTVETGGGIITITMTKWKSTAMSEEFCYTAIENMESHD